MSSLSITTLSVAGTPRIPSFDFELEHHHHHQQQERLPSYSLPVGQSLCDLITDENDKSTSIRTPAKVVKERCDWWNVPYAGQESQKVLHRSSKRPVKRATRNRVCAWDFTRQHLFSRHGEENEEEDYQLLQSPPRRAKFMVELERMLDQDEGVEQTPPRRAKFMVELDRILNPERTQSHSRSHSLPHPDSRSHSTPSPAKRAECMSRLDAVLHRRSSIVQTPPGRSRLETPPPRRAAFMFTLDEILDSDEQTPPRRAECMFRLDKALGIAS
ncbi:unnamed protein product [Sympodiomycopsis kandeliae]